MSHRKPIYTAFSFWDIVSSFLTHVLALGAAVYMGFHYDENPTVISVLIGFCLLLFSIIGEDQVYLNPDKLVMRTNSILSWLRPGEGSVFSLAEIRSAELPSEEIPGPLEVGFIVLLIAFLPKRGHTGTRQTTFYLNLKDGETTQLMSGITKAQASRLVEEINRLVNAKRQLR